MKKGNHFFIIEKNSFECDEWPEELLGGGRRVSLCNKFTATKSEDFFSIPNSYKLKVKREEESFNYQTSTIFNVTGEQDFCPLRQDVTVPFSFEGDLVRAQKRTYDITVRLLSYLE